MACHHWTSVWACAAALAPHGRATAATAPSNDLRDMMVPPSSIPPTPHGARPPLAGVQAPGEDALLRVQTVLGLVEHDRLRTVDDLVGDLVAAMGGQAVHEQCIRLGQRHQPGVDLIALE